MEGERRGTRRGENGVGHWVPQIFLGSPASHILPA